MAFPEKIPLSESFYQKRKERIKAIIQVTWIGIIVRLIIVAVELTAFFFFHSKALLFDSISTLVDVISSLFFVVSIWLAHRPADEEHPFGHGRYEPIAGLQLGLFLFISGIGLATEQILSLVSGRVEKEIDIHAWMVPFVIVIVLELVYRKMMKIAKNTSSKALLAEALHFRADSMNSLCALIALSLAAFFSKESAIIDALGALVIALLMCVMGIVACRNNIRQLVDHVPDTTWFNRVREAALACDGVLGVEKIRIQQYGPDAHVDIDVEVDPFLTVEVSHRISQRVRASIQESWPQVNDVIVHIEPFYPNDH